MSGGSQQPKITTNIKGFVRSMVDDPPPPTVAISSPSLSRSSSTQSLNQQKKQLSSLQQSQSSTQQSQLNKNKIIKKKRATPYDKQGQVQSKTVAKDASSAETSMNLTNTNLTDTSSSPKPKTSPVNPLLQKRMDERPVISGSNTTLDEFTSDYENQNSILNTQQGNLSVGQLNSNTTTLTSPRLLERRHSVTQMEIDQRPFQVPKKTFPLRKYTKIPDDTVSIKNKYNPISSSEEEDDAEELAAAAHIKKKSKITIKKTSSAQPSTSTATPNQPPTNPTARQPSQREARKEKMPPIVMEGIVQDLQRLRLTLANDYNVKTVSFKFTKFSTLIFTNTSSDYKNLLKYMRSQAETEEVQERSHFHTYTPASSKTHGFVLRGLDHKPTIEEVKEALMEEHEIECENIYEMRATQRPQYLVITSSSITLKYLNTTIKYLMSVRVFFEERHNKKRIIQCHRCQVWGHATSNCYRQHRCLKCAENHPTRSCQKPLSEKAKCANCRGDHPANATICPVYKEKLKVRDNNNQPTQTKPKQRYVEAPQPEHNAWTNRQIKHKENFPPLQGTSRPKQTQQTQQQTQNNPPNRPTGPESGFHQSRNLMDHLNSLINVGEANRAIADLITLLQQVTTGKERFDIYFRFMSDVETKYDLI